VCGYGRFGKALESTFRAHGISVIFIERDIELRNAPRDAIRGVGTEAETLLRADIQAAVGIVAGTDNDANNLSIIITARNLKPDLITVARQNLAANKPVFRAARVNMIMEPGRIIADQIFVLIKTPLAIKFIELLRQQDEYWARELLFQLSDIIQDKSLDLWALGIDQQRAPAIHDALASGSEVRSGLLCRDPRDREQGLPALVLLIQRGDEMLLLPDVDTRLQAGDEILVGGQHRARAFMNWITDNRNVLSYVDSGIEVPGGLVWRWLKTRQQRLK
jgi:Trk K+ transport system NAD-binding subunit